MLIQRDFSTPENRYKKIRNITHENACRLLQFIEILLLGTARAREHYSHLSTPQVAAFKCTYMKRELIGSDCPRLEKVPKGTKKIVVMRMGLEIEN